MTATPDGTPPLFNVPRSGGGVSTTPARPVEGAGRADETGPSAGYRTTSGSSLLLTAEGPRVLGLDLSITATGIAPWNSDPYTVGGPAADGDRRLRRIAEAVLRQATRVEWAVIEDLPTHAHGSGITGMVHGVVRNKLIELDIPYALVIPSVLKKYATGRGGASKSDMRMALYQRAGLDIPDDNQVDAWWLRCMGLDQLGAAPVRLPAAQRAALDKVTWPEVTTP